MELLDGLFLQETLHTAARQAAPGNQSTGIHYLHEGEKINGREKKHGNYYVKTIMNNEKDTIQTALMKQHCRTNKPKPQTE